MFPVGRKLRENVVVDEAYIWGSYHLVVIMHEEVKSMYNNIGDIYKYI